jgi:5-methyltetrahydrofolate--homocysteine methyltransferase
MQETLSVSPRLQNLIGRLRAGEVLLADGAWGTRMQTLGLQAGDCPEEWNISRPADIQRIAREYFEAGADFCLTNTFGANRYRLVRHGFADKVQEFNREGMRLVVEVANEFGRVAAASVGPTGEFIEPEGMLSRREVRAAFREQMEALKAGGAEWVCVETMYAVDEAVEAVKAAAELGLFCAACMTYDSDGRGGFQTMMGARIEEATYALDAAGADIVGSNCSNGIADMVRIACLMRPATRKPLMVKSNAGLPRKVDGQFIYDESPKMMAAQVAELKDAGVAVIGGCCGTTPEHIAAFRAAMG